MNYNNDNQLGLSAINTSTHAVLTPDPKTGQVTLAATTYVIPLGTEASMVPGQTALLAAQLAWDTNVRGTITVEACLFPATKTNKNLGPPDVTDDDQTAGNWIPLGTSDGRCDAVAATATGLSVGTITGQGGALWTLQDFGAMRARLRLVLTTGGVVRARARGKYGS